MIKEQNTGVAGRSGEEQLGRLLIRQIKKMQHLNSTRENSYCGLRHRNCVNKSSRQFRSLFTKVDGVSAK